MTSHDMVRALTFCKLLQNLHCIISLKKKASIISTLEGSAKVGPYAIVLQNYIGLIYYYDFQTLSPSDGLYFTNPKEIPSFDDKVFSLEYANAFQRQSITDNA